MASSSWQQMMKDSSPHGHRSADEGGGLPDRLSPGPTGHPKQGLERLRYQMRDVVL